MSAGPRLTRGEVWSRLGPPTEQVGSVNDPRTREEHGVRWNEKWIYLDEATGRPVRLVLWERYDLRGCFDVGADGQVQRESLGDV